MDRLYHPPGLNANFSPGTAHPDHSKPLLITCFKIKLIRHPKFRKFETVPWRRELLRIGESVWPIKSRDCLVPAFLGKLLWGWEVQKINLHPFPHPNNQIHVSNLKQLQIASQPQTVFIRIAGLRNCPRSVLNANPDRPLKGRLAGHIRIEIPPTVLLQPLLQASLRTISNPPEADWPNPPAAGKNPFFEIASPWKPKQPAAGNFRFKPELILTKCSF